MRGETTLKLFQLIFPVYGVEHSCGLLFIGHYDNLFLQEYRIRESSWNVFRTNF